jgi:hypothetical protein
MGIACCLEGKDTKSATINFITAAELQSIVKTKISLSNYALFDCRRGNKDDVV